VVREPSLINPSRPLLIRIGLAIAVFVILLLVRRRVGPSVWYSEALLLTTFVAPIIVFVLSGAVVEEARRWRSRT
jgi:hypothetical protein